MGVPQNRWFIMENPNLKWMTRGYPHFRKHPFILYIHKYPLVNQHNHGKSPFIVDFPIEHGDFPVRYVKLPEGTSHQILLNYLFPMVFPRVFLWFSNVFLWFSYGKLIAPAWPSNRCAKGWLSPTLSRSATCPPNHPWRAGSFNCWRNVRKGQAN